MREREWKNIGMNEMNEGIEEGSKDARMSIKLKVC